jgi:hypothetical protein
MAIAAFAEQSRRFESLPLAALRAQTSSLDDHVSFSVGSHCGVLVQQYYLFVSINNLCIFETICASLRIVGHRSL